LSHAVGRADRPWAGLRGTVPATFDGNPLDHMGEGLRITPVRIFSRGRSLDDVAPLTRQRTPTLTASAGIAPGDSNYPTADAMLQVA
jgi:hypothetical protein